MKPRHPHHKDDKGQHQPDNSKPIPKEELEDLKNFKKDKVRIVPSKKQNRITFDNFLQFFPFVELPYTITSDTQRLISKKNDPLAVEWLFNFVLDQDAAVDEYTEFMPCFSIPDTHGFWAVVYWEAGIEGTTYFLTTFSKEGVLIDKKKIAGTKYTEDGLYQMVCTIGESWLFSCAEGRLDAQGNTAPISSDTTHLHTTLQMTGDGEIVAI
jgi:hypothetical protein